MIAIGNPFSLYTLHQAADCPKSLPMNSLLLDDSHGDVLYKDLKSFYRGRKHQLLRGRRSSDGKSVVIKTLLVQTAGAVDTALLEREYQCLKTLHLQGAVKMLAFTQLGGKPALIMEDAGTATLESFLAQRSLDLASFIHLAIGLAESLELIHRAGLIHLDLCPANIVLNDRLRPTLATIVDFGSAIVSAQMQQSQIDPPALEGTLAYRSPEQTGRMNQSIEYTSDLYSLGAVFYEMLTGRPPFLLEDPLELVHAHLSYLPLAPHKINNAVPELLSAIVLKLLTKRPEERYQSAYGLAQDLTKISLAMEDHGDIEPFDLGQEDSPHGLSLPSRLYGREQEIAALMAAFNRTVEQGSAGLLLVSGYSGVGKTTLVRELYKPLIQDHGFFISGKFDQYRANVPFSTTTQAFKEFIHYLLTKSEERVDFWRTELHRALGPNGAVIVNIIPELALLIGEQPPVALLPAAEEQLRFDITFSKFVAVFARPEHPLVIFLDDLQWADAASLRLIKNLICQDEIGNLLIIGAFRSNEVGREHPLTQTIMEMSEMGAALEQVMLRSLSPEMAAALVCDVLRCGEAQVAALAKLVYEKTQGNPFFTLQFLKMLYQEQLLQFDRTSHGWKWDLDRVEAQGYADNIVDLLLTKLLRLPGDVRDILKLAACLGDKGELSSLAILSERSDADIGVLVKPAIDQGLLLSQAGTYKFLHDRVQQAAYSLIPEEDRSQQHLKIGRLLLSSLSPSAVDEQVFDIVNHLNLGKALITESAERLRLVELDLMAGKLAKANTAYDSAIHIFEQGASLIDQDLWLSKHDLCFSLSFELAECHWLCGNFDQSVTEFARLLTISKTKLEKARIYKVAVELHTGKTDLEGSIASAIDGLKLFGIDMSPAPLA
jgi:tRNA A-37 threonylcarbamoyl transferase component Bud32/tetratricopeptide (TPR) repeat protein